MEVLSPSLWLGILYTDSVLPIQKWLNVSTHTLILHTYPIYSYPSHTSHTLTDFEIKREDDRIHKIFQDPTGNHLIVSMATSKEAYYIGRATGKRTVPKSLPKVRGHLVESVAWNKLDGAENGTGPILIGTSTGKRGC